MIDFTLEGNGDLRITEEGDIEITDSINQAVLIRLRWIYGEWRLNPDYGLTWFEDIFVKNPDFDHIKDIIKDEIEQVQGVDSAKVDTVEYDRRLRTLRVKYHFTVGEAVYDEEVVLNE